ncbi:MAG TPA: hypothetical protein VMX14_02505 [Anaerolineae bacterium]|nr:hypothetical protein [Anaerolineae bacterium]
MSTLDDIESLVREILGDGEGPWPADITDCVFEQIEGDPGRLRRYWTIVQHLNAQGKNGQQVVNQYIGRRVKQLTTKVNQGWCDSPRSSLIKGYTKH